jgi:hypothetical protein
MTRKGRLFFCCLLYCCLVGLIPLAIVWAHHWRGTFEPEFFDMGILQGDRFLVVLSYLAFVVVSFTLAIVISFLAPHPLLWMSAVPTGFVLVPAGLVLGGLLGTLTLETENQRNKERAGALIATLKQYHSQYRDYPRCLTALFDRETLDFRRGRRDGVLRYYRHDKDHFEMSILTGGLHFLLYDSRSNEWELCYDD